MILHLKASMTEMGGGFPAIIRLAAGTVLAEAEGSDPSAAFRDLDDVVVGLKIPAPDAPQEAAPKAGRVSHRKGDRVLTVEVTLAPDPVFLETPREEVDAFVAAFDAGVAALAAWCDRKDAFADRAAFEAPIAAAREALAAGRFARPWEFAAHPATRAALDAAWTLLETTPLEEERARPVAEAYLLLRDAGWQEVDETEPPNLASNPPPEGQGYTLV